MKYIALTLCIIAILGLAVSSFTDTDFKPPKFSQLLKVIADSGINYDDTVKSFLKIRDYMSRADTFISFDKFSSGLQDDEIGVLRKILNVVVSFFNNVLDFFVVLGYTIKALIVFVLDTLHTVFSLINVIFKLVGISPI